jgi:transcription initiation factor TFIIIB Brf1 subunit/transcription initiation factor TFIIB
MDRILENTCPFTGQPAGHKELPNGDLVCNHCGSLCPEQFLKYVDMVINDPSIDFRIELSDRRHKVYMHKEGVKNAAEGAIKHYLVHLKKYCEDNGISAIDIDDKLHNAFNISKEKSSVYLEIFEQKLKNNML